jgi:hypothetical protein
LRNGNFRHTDVLDNWKLETVASLQIERRSISTGQKALAHALIYPEAARLKRKGSASVDLQNQDQGAVSHARTVIEYAPELVDNVKSGMITVATSLQGSAPLAWH